MPTAATLTASHSLGRTGDFQVIHAEAYAPGICSDTRYNIFSGLHRWAALRLPKKVRTILLRLNRLISILKKRSMKIRVCLSSSTVPAAQIVIRLKWARKLHILKHKRKHSLTAMILQSIIFIISFQNTHTIFLMSLIISATLCRFCFTELFHYKNYQDYNQTLSLSEKHISGLFFLFVYNFSFRNTVNIWV